MEIIRLSSDKLNEAGVPKALAEDEDPADVVQLE